MSMYVVYKMRLKGRKSNCLEFENTLVNYYGQLEEPHIIQECGSDESYAIELSGVLRGGVFQYMIDLPEYESTLEGQSRLLNLSIEVFESDPGDEEFSYFYYQNGICIEMGLPSYISCIEEFDEYEISEDDQKKYMPIENDQGYCLRKEYYPDAHWEKNGNDEQMICHFKITMD